MDNPEYELLKELRRRYRNKYKFLNISLGRSGRKGHGERELAVAYDSKKAPQIHIVLIENGAKLSVKMSKHLTPVPGGDSVTLASPHMLTRLDKIVHSSVLEYIKKECADRIRTSEARINQIVDIKHQIERLNADAKTLSSIIKNLGGRS